MKQKGLSVSAEQAFEELIRKLRVWQFNECLECDLVICRHPTLVNTAPANCQIACLTPLNCQTRNFRIGSEVSFRGNKIEKYIADLIVENHWIPHPVHRNIRYFFIKVGLSM